MHSALLKIEVRVGQHVAYCIITQTKAFVSSPWSFMNHRSTTKLKIVQVERADPELVRRDRLNSCHLSSADLQAPIVADFLGNLYTKASLLEFLLARDHAQFADLEAEHRFDLLFVCSPRRTSHRACAPSYVALMCAVVDLSTSCFPMTTACIM